jgi:DNA-directed RNA polymerase beta subunit
MKFKCEGLNKEIIINNNEINYSMKIGKLIECMKGKVY